MNIRTEWGKKPEDDISGRFYTVEETINSVLENFNLRRFYTPEGKNITINGVTEKCLVQISSNPLRELDDQRKIHCPLSMEVQRGDYVEHDNNIWLITTNVVNVGGAYQSARMSMCNYLLKWQNENGKIIERWAYIASASKYNDGISDNKIISLGSDQLLVIVPVDSESIKLKKSMGKKFFIDNNTKDPIVYELTGTGNVSGFYNGHGVTNWIVKEVAYSPTPDDLKYGVCNYISPQSTPQNETAVLTTSIIGQTSLKVGLSSTYTATFTDKYNNKVENINFSWNLVSKYSDKISYETNKDSSIKIQTDDFSLIGKTFLLQIVRNEDKEIMSETKITVVGLF